MPVRVLSVHWFNTPGCRPFGLPEVPPSVGSERDQNDSAGTNVLGEEDNVGDILGICAIAQAVQAGFIFPWSGSHLASAGGLSWTVPRAALPTPLD
jgi:hypothetical protein